MGLPSDSAFRISNSIKINFQSYIASIDELYEKADKCYARFCEKIRALQGLTGASNVLIPEVKRRDRAELKAQLKYSDARGVAWYRLTDIVRATLLFNGVESMYGALHTIEND